MTVAVGHSQYRQRRNRCIGEGFSWTEAEFEAALGIRDWEAARPRGAALDGAGYRRIWEVLSGEQGGGG